MEKAILNIDNRMFFDSQVGKRKVPVGFTVYLEASELVGFMVIVA